MKTLKKTIKAAMAVMLSFSMMLATGLFAFTAESYAASENPRGQDEPLGSESEAGAASTGSPELIRSDPFAFRPGKALKALEKDAADYPDAFDLRNVDTDGDGKGDKSFVTKVKVQNPYGTCWGFAAIAAAESSLIAGGLADENVDLSEKQVAYFVNSYIDDPEDPQNGEGVHFRGITDKELKTSSYIYNTGGYSFFATNLFASGSGPVLENAVDPETGESLEDIFAYKGAKGEKVVRRTAIAYDKDGNPTAYARRPVWYSDDDDWSMPEKSKYYQSYRLKESFLLPSLWKYDVFAGTEEFSEAGLNALKQQLFENHRAISIGYCTESYLPGQDTSDKKYMSSHWAHYVSEPEFSNHCVTVVGWDDNYPKENFLTEPERDGAFLVKNSWGSELNEFPNNGFRHWGLLEGMDKVPYDKNAEASSDRATGYFWLSYCDKSLNSPETFAFEEATEANERSIAQTDLMVSADYFVFEEENCRSANVFTCKDTSELKEISVLTGAPGTEVAYEVYALPEDFEGPEDGVKIAEGKQTFEYGGYHKISVSTDRVLSRDQKYSVVVSQNYEGQSYVPFAANYTAVTGSFYNVAVCNGKESYCFYDGKWEDISNKDVQDRICDNSPNMEMDNFPIKAYLKPVFDGYLAVSNWQEGTPGSFHLYTEQKKAVAAEFRGLSGDMPDDWDPLITWTSSDEAVAKVNMKGDDYGQAVIEGISEGQAYITVDAGEYGSRVIGIKVEKPSIDFASFDDSDKVYTGKPITVDIIFVNINGPGGEEPPTLAEGVDYTVEYKNNIKPGKALVFVKGIGKYSGVYTDYFNILKAANKMTAAGKTAKLKASALKKKSKTISASKAYKVTSAGGKLTYSKVSVNKKKYAKKFSVNKTNGKITVKKGVKKGTYKLNVKISDSGGDCFTAAEKTVKVTIKVK